MATAAAPISPIRFLQLLADDQRWQLVRELARSDRKVSELTELVDRPQNLVSYHLASLRNAGVVSARRSSADRRDAYYRLDIRRCGDLLSQVGSAIQPALRLGVTLPQPSGATRRRPSVLFLCTGNSTRSQMAEALLEHYSAGAIRASSGGSHPKPLHPNTVRVMAERGIDVSMRKSKHLDRFREARFDRVVTLCDRVREICPEFPRAAAVAHWSMPDPASEGTTDDASYPAFVRTAAELEERMPFLIGELTLSTERGKPHD